MAKAPKPVRASKLAKELKLPKDEAPTVSTRKRKVIEKVNAIKRTKKNVVAPSRIPAPNLKFRYDTARIKLLKSLGVDGTAIQVMRQPFILDDALVSITPMVPKWLPEDYQIPKTSVRRQVETCYRMLTKPLHGSPIICIGSMVTDERAKFMAMNIMDAAIDQQRSGSHKGKQLPLYHRVMGNFYDELLSEKTRRNISMLIIGNVALDSTQVKIEKVRDLLEKYDNIPRIVVVNGCDPVTFFAEKIRMPVQFALMLNSKRSDKADLMELL